MEILYRPWPWYIAGPILGLTVPLLLFLGNKRLGISSTLRQVCAACYPARIPFLNYDWKNQSWNLFFAAGILVGGFIGGKVFENPQPVDLSPGTVQYLQSFGLQTPKGFLPEEIFNWSTLLSMKGFYFIMLGGFLVGFGTRYAGGCTSGHGLLGLSALQWPSLLATASFFIGGIFFHHFILSFVLNS